MSAETCGGYIPATWEYFDDDEVVTDRFFLRDDKSAGLCDYERYSLFRDFPKEDYGRIIVLALPLSLAIRSARDKIKEQLGDLS